MGMADWFKSQQQKMDKAQHVAADLHARFGRRARSFCTDELITAETREQRRALRQVAKVLKHMDRS